MTDNEQLEARLARIETKVDALIEKVDDHEQTTKERSDQLQRILHGRDGSAGALVRIDRLEQDCQRRTLRERTIFSAIVALLAKAGFDLFGN